MRFLLSGLAVLAAFCALPAAVQATDAAAPETAAPTSLLLRIANLDCSGCEGQVGSTLSGLEFVGEAAVRFTSEESSPACVSLTAPLDEPAMAAALQGIGYRLLSTAATDRCQREALPAGPGFWEQHGQGLDVRRISSGQEVELTAHLREGGYTVVDFGAPWCGPCHASAEQLAGYLGAHADTAVREVSLEAEDPNASFALPVVAQHLRYAPGLPFFIVFGPNGAVLHRGGEVDPVLASIDRHRRRQERRQR